jgi:hypothetical protein
METALTESETFAIDSLLATSAFIGFGLIGTSNRYDFPLVSLNNITITEDLTFATDVGLRGFVGALAFKSLETVFQLLGWTDPSQNWIVIGSSVLGSALVSSSLPHLEV